MTRASSWRRIAWIAAVLLGVVVLAFTAVFARWFAVAGVQGGFDAAVRFLRHGTTTIDDFPTARPVP